MCIRDRFKVNTHALEDDDEFICKPDEIADTLTARYDEVNSTESYPLNFLARKEEIEYDLDFECEGYRSYNVSFTMKELQSLSALPATLQRDRTIFFTAPYVNCRM